MSTPGRGGTGGMLESQPQEQMALLTRCRSTCRRDVRTADMPTRVRPRARGTIPSPQRAGVEQEHVLVLTLAAAPSPLSGGPRDRARRAAAAAVPPCGCG